MCLRSTEPPLLPNPCYKLAFCLSLLCCPLFAVSWCVGLVALLHFFVWHLRWQKMQMCYQKRWLILSLLRFLLFRLFAVVSPLFVGLYYFVRQFVILFFQLFLFVWCRPNLELETLEFGLGKY